MATSEVTCASVAVGSSRSRRNSIRKAAADHQFAERLGLRKDKGFKDLEKATLSVEGVGATMQSLLRLLARSRKVELDIIATQFGPIISPQHLQQMKLDLADLERTLGEEKASELRTQAGQSVQTA